MISVGRNQRRIKRSMLLTSKIRNTVKSTIEQEKEQQNIDLILLLVKTIKDGNIHLGIRLVLFFVIASSFSMCAYHIEDRVAHYLSVPIRVDVQIANIANRKLPSLSICAKNSDFLEYCDTNRKQCYLDYQFFCYNDMEPFQNIIENVSADIMWSVMNLSKIIVDANLINKTENKQLQLRNFNLTDGMCVEIYDKNQLSFGNPDVKMNIRFNLSKIKCDDLLIISIQSQGQKIFSSSVLPAIRLDYTGMAFSISMQEYTFLDTTRNPCVSMEDYDRCAEKCHQNVYSKFIKDCRFPFMTTRNKLPYCNPLGNIFFQYIKAEREILRVNPRILCGCSRQCHQTSYSYVTKISFNNPQTSIEVSIDHSYVRKMIEKEAYGFISLLCDMGGSIGLFLGLSCLSIVQLIISGNIGRKNYQKDVRKENKLHTKVNDFIQQEVKDRLNKKIFLGKLQRFKLSVKRVQICVAIVLFLYQLCDIFAVYFRYPTIISVEVVIDENVQLPIIALCASSRKITQNKIKISRFSNTSCVKLDFLDLLDSNVSTFVHNPELLWSSSYAHEDYYTDYLYSQFKSTNLSEFPTVYGNCVKVKTGEVVFTGSGTNLEMIKQEISDECNCGTQVFTPTNEKILNLENYIFSSCNAKTEIKFNRQTIVKINSPKQRCDTSEKVTRCEENCHMKKLNHLKITCRLPFMDVVDKPLCNTTTSAKATRRKYIDDYLTTNPRHDCGCVSSCNETIYIPSVHTARCSAFADNTNSVFSLQSNIREIIVQNLAIPIEKLLCDIGSNLGMLLGMSVLSFMDLMQQTIQKLHNSLNKS